MSIKAAIQHNQALAAAAVLCLLLGGGLFSCHLTQAQKKEILTTATIVGTAVVEQSPIPWDKIGLLIGTILGAGAIVDNRRKDVVIKQEQKYNDQKTELLAKLVNGNSTNPPK